jgi:hypothetical protein
MEEHTQKVPDNKELRVLCGPDKRDNVRDNLKYYESTMGNGLKS